jgi:hypothetical protein
MPQRIQTVKQTPKKTQLMVKKLPVPSNPKNKDLLKTPAQKKMDVFLKQKSEIFDDDFSKEDFMLLTRRWLQKPRI